MRVVLDTNILCSALLTPGGPTDRLYRAWRDKRFELITSEEQLDELRRITRYPRVRAYIEPAAAGSMLNELRRLATFVTKLPAVDQSRDPGDNFLLAMVQVGKADVLVTCDKHDLLSLRSFRRTRIIAARQLLGQLGNKMKTPKRNVAAASRRKRKTSR